MTVRYSSIVDALRIISAFVIILTMLFVYTVGGFVIIDDSTDGIVNRKVLSACVSSKSCSAPVTPTGRHLKFFCQKKKKKKKLISNRPNELLNEFKTCDSTKEVALQIFNIFTVF